MGASKDKCLPFGTEYIYIYIYIYIYVKLNRYAALSGIYADWLGYWSQSLFEGESPHYDKTFQTPGIE
jgi:hypothetical protein